jgi:alkylhydroperoxidase family enzyme
MTREGTAEEVACCKLGISTEKIEALNDYANSRLFDDAEKAALEYADAITDTRRDVDDELFARLQRHYDDDTIAELTMIIAWQNASSRFNRAFRIPSQGFWKRSLEEPGQPDQQKR